MVNVASAGEEAASGRRLELSDRFWTCAELTRQRFMTKRGSSFKPPACFQGWFSEQQVAISIETGWFSEQKGAIKIDVGWFSEQQIANSIVAGLLPSHKRQ